MAIPTLQQNLGVHSRFDHTRRAPFAGNQRVVSQMPPEVIAEILRPAIDFPLPENIEAVRVQHEYASGSLPVRCTERAEENPVRATMDGVWAAISGTGSDRLRFNDLDDFRFAWIGLRIDDVNSGRADAGHDQIAPLGMGMRRVRAQASAARVPAEVMQFISGVGHIHLPDK